MDALIERAEQAAAEALAKDGPGVDAVHISSALPDVGTAYLQLDDEEKEEDEPEGAFDFVINVTKADPDKQFIFGWASISTVNGQLVVDKQDDMIEIAELEKAAYDFVIYSREHGQMHSTRGTGRCIESCVFTPEKAAVGITAKNENGEALMGWWVGFHVTNADTWATHKAGGFPEFSIGGRATPHPVSAPGVLAEVNKYSPDEPRDNQGKWTSGGWGHSASDETRFVNMLARDWSVYAMWEQFQNNARYVLAGKERPTEGKDQQKAYDDAKKLLDTINNGPDVGAPLYRGIQGGETYKVGDTFSESLSSWTGDKSLANDFATGAYGNRAFFGGGATVFDVMSSPNSKGIELSSHMKASWFDGNTEKFGVFKAAQEWLTSGEYRVTGISHAGGVKHVHVTRIGPAKVADLVKYSPDQPRDKDGKWTDEAGGAQFFSGNKDDLSFDEAATALASADQKRIELMSADVDRELGLTSHDTPIIGAWSDGAENSVMTTVENSDWNKLELAAAMKGSLADQKAVLIFQEAAGGGEALASFDAHGDIASIHSSLLADGLAFHSLVPTAGGAHVVVAVLDHDTADAVSRGASRYGSAVQFRTGNAAFIGTDGEGSRAQAQAIYTRIIGGSRVEGAASKWQGLRDRWSAIAKAIVAILGKYSPDELRDWHGRWTDGSSPAEALYNAQNDPGRDLTAEQIIAQANGEDRVKKVEELLAEAPATDELVADGGFKNPDGTWTDEREALHEMILDEKFNAAAVAAATPAPGEDPTLTVLGGRGGSGKSWLTGANGPVDPDTSIVLDADEFKSLLPGYEGWNAALYHEESSYLIEQADLRAKALGVNVVHDATMKTGATIAGRVAGYQAAGYKINGYYMFAPPQVAATRAINRFLNGGTHGRYVPVRIILGNTQNEANFDRLIPSFAKWAVYDNSKSGGGSPVLTAHGGK